MGFMAGYLVVVFVSTAEIFRGVLGITAVTALVVGLVVSVVAFGVALALARLRRHADSL
jgi:hypothetical protein